MDIDFGKGDFRDAASCSAKAGVDAPDHSPRFSRVNNYVGNALRSLASLHDGGGVHATLLDLGRSPSYQKSLGFNAAADRVAVPLQDVAGCPTA